MPTPGPFRFGDHHFSFFLFGTVGEMVVTLKERREKLGISYFTVMSEANIEPFAPVLERLVGS